MRVWGHPAPQPHTCLAWLSERCAWSSSSRRASSSCRSCSICTLWSSSCNHTPTPGPQPQPAHSGLLWHQHTARVVRRSPAMICRRGVQGFEGDVLEGPFCPRQESGEHPPSLGAGGWKHPNPSICTAASSWGKKRQMWAEGMNHELNNILLRSQSNSFPGQGPTSTTITTPCPKTAPSPCVCCAGKGSVPEQGRILSYGSLPSSQPPA